MRLPEFTAEASLGKAEEGYIVKSAVRPEPGTILPQLRGFKALCDNDGNCIYVFQKEGQISVLQAFPPNKGGLGGRLL